MSLNWNVQRGEGFKPKNSVGEYGMDISWNNTITILGGMFQAVLGCSIFWV